MARQPRSAVLGRPIGHSLSPVLHRAAYAALGLNWSYDAIDCGTAELPAVLAERADWAGFSCTMPLKHAALEIADDVRPVARAAGAANTLLPRTGGGWSADNTDVAGIVATVEEGSLRPERATLLGAGGTAQAAVVALVQIGIRRCSVLVRDVRRTDRLCATAAAVGMEIEVGLVDVDAPALAADLIISTLPPGAADQFAGRTWPPGLTLLDVVYEPWPTPLAASVAAAGGTVLSGALMLLHQAAAQVQLMTGRPAPVAAMRAALRTAAPRCGA